MLTLNGVTMSRKAWAKHADIKEDMLRKRLSRGMSLQEAITTERARYTGSAASDLVAAAKDNPCQDCGIKYHKDAMEFDHVRGTKEFNISNYAHYGFEKVKRELAKCDLVCANCHRIRTASRR